MRNIISTRTELQARKAQVALAQQGRALLEQKQAVLLKEFMRSVDTAVERSEVLEQAATKANLALGRAEAFAGVEAVRSAALASQAEFSLRVETVSVMGVKVPHIEQRRVSRSALERGFAVTGTSLLIDEVADAFESQVDAIIMVAESELRLLHLAREIQKTTRRLNALDHVVIPRLNAEVNYIKMTLDERERADHFRLKRVKKVLEIRRSTTG